MKKILIALAVLASVQGAFAQVKPDAAKKALDAAVAAAQNPKKATKAATWQALGKAYVSAYDAPAGNIWVGATKQDLKLLMSGQNPTSVEEVTIGGQPYTKEVYADKNLYFQADGRLAVIEVTKPLAENALDEAVKAYQKVYELDSKKDKEVKSAIEDIAKKYTQQAFDAYTLGDLATASALFEKVADINALAPVNQLDTNSLYNAGFTAQAARDNERAKNMFKKCYEVGYYAENGDVFARLAEVDTVGTKQYLEEGFQKFPQSQSIMIGLINYYLKSGESTDRLFDLLDKAKANEPGNASLWYVEGNTRAQLGDVEAAIAAYEKCAEIDPNYEFGYIGEGILFYNQAIDVQTKAQEEFDDNKYAALVAEFEKDLKGCIAPFEKAYALSKDNSIKVSIAEYLKNAYYRFRDQDPSFQAGYDKYSEVVSTGVAK